MKDHFLTFGDGLLAVAVLVSAVILSVILPRLMFSGGAFVEVCSGRETRGKYVLDQDTDVEVQGPFGKTIIQISEARARIISSPCKNKICVHMGSVGKEGGILVCIPNEVVVRIGSELSNGLDAVTP